MKAKKRARTKLLIRQTRWFRRDEICRIFKVPPRLVNPEAIRLALRYRA